jgi:hypothetical protein
MRKYGTYAAAATVEPNDRNLPKIRMETLGNWLTFEITGNGNL